MKFTADDYRIFNLADVGSNPLLKDVRLDPKKVTAFRAREKAVKKENGELLDIKGCPD